VGEVYALIEQLRLMVLPDPKALSRVEQPESLLKDCQNVFVRHAAVITRHTNSYPGVSRERHNLTISTVGFPNKKARKDAAGPLGR
jgi:hypothetical protein